MISKYLILMDAKITEALEKLNQVNGVGLIVVDKQNTLKGTLTDGDVRRWILRGGDVNEAVEKAAFTKPLATKSSRLSLDLAEECRRRYIRILPYVNDENIVLDCVLVEENSSFKKVPIVIMAGGLGSRLGELTTDCPKPMLKISGKPILELIIQSLVKEGFREIYLSVNYLSEIIEEHFKDGKDLNCRIKYIHENKKLGTAGSLSLIEEEISGPVLVMNGDIITETRFQNLVEFHVKDKNHITLGARKYDFQVPFGVISIDKDEVKGIVEKPKHEFLVSGGVYVVDAEIIKHIPKNKYYDMPTLINNMTEANKKIGCFPIYEEWIDIGRSADLKIAREKYED